MRKLHFVLALAVYGCVFVTDTFAQSPLPRLPPKDGAWVSPLIFGAQA
jgi:hypothetical protein